MLEVEEKRPRLPLALLILASAVVVGGLLVFRNKPAPPAERIEVRGSPDVIVAMRDLSKLETSSFHVEKVIEITDNQKSVWGLVDSKDALLLVAVGEVVAGVDLEKLEGAAVSSDWPKKSVNVTLPAPEIFFSRLDNAATHVYSRSTDTLAKRNENLEARARLEAENSMREAAIKGGILLRARAQAERTVRATLRSLGFEQITIAFPEK